MSEKEKFKLAKDTLNEGKQKEAAEMLLDLYASTKNRSLKLQVILALQAALNQAHDVEKLLEASEEGLKLAKVLNDNIAIAYLSAQRASNLHHHRFMLNHQQQQLVTAKGWDSFALERDKKMFDGLQKIIVEVGKEIQVLINEAVKLTNSINRADLKGQVLLCLGQVYSQSYFDHKIMLLSRSNAKRFARYIHFRPIMRFNLENYLLFNRSDRKILYGYINACINSFLQAIHTYEVIGDRHRQAYAFLELTNNLKTFNRFKDAEKYLKLAKALAADSQDKFLLKKISEMEEILKDRNKHIPDYMEGERRKPRD